MREAVNEALKTAMKSRDAARVSALRMISAAIKDRDIEARGAGRRRRLRRRACRASLAKMIRQREEFGEGLRRRAAGRSSPAKERAEIEVIRGFLPKQMAEEEMRAAVERRSDSRRRHDRTWAR